MRRNRRTGGKKQILKVEQLNCQLFSVARKIWNISVYSFKMVVCIYTLVFCDPPLFLIALDIATFRLTKMNHVSLHRIQITGGI